jgi:hypothetical protein
MNLEKLFSPKEASEILNISANTLRNWKPEIGYLELGSRIYFRQSDLEAFFETRLVETREKVHLRRWRLLSRLRSH